MRQLVLLRHGEAHSAAPGGSDFQRSLTVNGRVEALAAAEAIVQAQLRIERVLVSPARRTLETAEVVMERLLLAHSPEQQEGLYLATRQGLLQALSHCQAACHTVMLIGHNPGLSELAERLTDGAASFSLRTAGVCLLSFNSDGWRDLAADIAESCQLLR